MHILWCMGTKVSVNFHENVVNRDLLRVMTCDVITLKRSRFATFSWNGPRAWQGSDVARPEVFSSERSNKSTNKLGFHWNKTSPWIPWNTTGRCSTKWSQIQTEKKRSLSATWSLVPSCYKAVDDYPPTPTPLPTLTTPIFSHEILARIETVYIMDANWCFLVNTSHASWWRDGCVSLMICSSNS